LGLVITQVQTNAVKTKNDVNEMHIGGVLKLKPIRRALHNLKT
jgi:hypothetical protein